MKSWKDDELEKLIKNIRTVNRIIIKADQKPKVSQWRQRIKFRPRGKSGFREATMRV